MFLDDGSQFAGLKRCAGSYSTFNLRLQFDI